MKFQQNDDIHMCEVFFMTARSNRWLVLNPGKRDLATLLEISYFFYERLIIPLNSEKICILALQLKEKRQGFTKRFY